MRRELTFEAKGKVLTCCQLFTACAPVCCQCLLCDALQPLLAVAAPLHNPHSDCLGADDSCWAGPLLRAPGAGLQGLCSSNSATPSKNAACTHLLSQRTYLATCNLYIMISLMQSGDHFTAAEQLTAHEQSSFLRR